MVGPTAIAALGSCLPLLVDAVEAFLSTEEALAYGHICCQLVTRAFAEHLAVVGPTAIAAVGSCLPLLVDAVEAFLSTEGTSAASW